MLPLFIGLACLTPFFYEKISNIHFVFIFLDISQTLNSQDIDINDVLERLERIEKNISDLQKGKLKILKNLFLQDIFLGMNQDLMI